MASAIIKILSGDVFLRFSSISFISLDIKNSSKPHNPISSERRAFWKDYLKFFPIAIASPTDFIDDESIGSDPGNFSKANLGIFVTT